MPLYRVTGDVLTAYGEILELPRGFDPDDESVRTAVASAAGVYRYGRESGITIDSWEEVDEDGNEIASTESPSNGEPAIEIVPPKTLTYAQAVAVRGFIDNAVGAEDRARMVATLAAVCPHNGDAPLHVPGASVFIVTDWKWVASEAGPEICPVCETPREAYESTGALPLRSGASSSPMRD